MRVYIESHEIVSSDDISGEFIRADVTGMSFADIVSVTESVEDIMKGLNYRLTTHYCGHDEKNICTMEPII
uniref:Uncharacterized protein n=1 Tax=viral metagenome TaxID=1070528 RepID=A0A6M3L7V9_9ZZZZ